MVRINYNFGDAVRGVKDIPPPGTGGFRSGPAQVDKPFLDFVIKSLREEGSGGMPFNTKKEREMASYRIHRWIRKEHGINLEIMTRSQDDGRFWLYWRLVEDSADESEDGDSLVAEESPAELPPEPVRDDKEDGQWPY